MGCISGLAQCFLVIANSIFVIAGLVAVGRGVYFRIGAAELSKNVAYRLLGIDELYKQISIKFIVPGSIMLFVSCMGCCGAAKENKKLLSIYCICMTILTVVNIYNLSSYKSKAISIMSYLKNNVFAPGIETELFGGNVYPELGVQVVALLLAVYLWCHISEKHKQAKNFQIPTSDIPYRIRVPSV